MNPYSSFWKQIALLLFSSVSGRAGFDSFPNDFHAYQSQGPLPLRLLEAEERTKSLWHSWSISKTFEILGISFLLRKLCCSALVRDHHGGPCSGWAADCPNNMSSLLSASEASMPGFTVYSLWLSHCQHYEGPTLSLLPWNISTGSWTVKMGYGSEWGFS